jgi:hypothetical protein
MLCRDIARALRGYGIRVASAYAGDDEEDGDLTVAWNVHVQVPTFGGMPRVVVDAFRGQVRCYPPRSNVAELAADIRAALSETPSAIPSSSVH